MSPDLVDYNRIEIKHMKRGQLFDHTNIPMVGGHDSSEGGQPTSLLSDLVLACCLIQYKNNGLRKCPKIKTKTSCFDLFGNESEIDVDSKMV